MSTPKKETETLSITKGEYYGVDVGYKGQRKDVIEFLSRFEVWPKDVKPFIASKQEVYWFSFDISIFEYLKTANFQRVMQSFGVKCEYPESY